MRGRMSTTGFTLVELIVTVAIVAILAAFAVPSMERVIRAVRVDTETTNLLNVIQAARSEAVKRGVAVSISAPGNWTGSIRAFVDPNENMVEDAGELLVAQTNAGNKVAAGTVTAHLENGLVFSGTGTLLSNPNATGRRLGAIAVKADDGKYWALICVNETGRNRIFKPVEPTAAAPTC